MDKRPHFEIQIGTGTEKEGVKKLFLKNAYREKDKEIIDAYIKSDAFIKDLKEAMPKYHEQLKTYDHSNYLPKQLNEKIAHFWNSYFTDNNHYLLPSDKLNDKLERYVQYLHKNHNSTEELLQSISHDFNSELEFKKKFANYLVNNGIAKQHELVQQIMEFDGSMTTELTSKFMELRLHFTPEFCDRETQIKILDSFNNAVVLLTGSEKTKYDDNIHSRKIELTETNDASNDNEFKIKITNTKRRA